MEFTKHMESDISLDEVHLKNETEQNLQAEIKPDETEYNSNASMNLNNITGCNAALEYKRNMLDKRTLLSSEPEVELAKNKKFHCKHCGFIGWSRCSLANHIMEKHNNRYKCDFCEFTGSKKFLRFHIKKEHSSHICHNEKTRYFECPLCKYSAFRKCDLTRHYKNSHKELEMLLKEDKNVLLDKSQDLRFKIKEYRLKEAIGLNSKNFSNSYNIAASVICSNNRDKNIYYCCLCKYKGDKLSLKQHFSDKHENELFVCECCTFQATTRTFLSCDTRRKDKRKMWMHCQLCMFKTREDTAFFTHFRRKHWNSKHYFCKVCKFNTQVKGDLNMHLKKEHPKVSREFRCQLCNSYTTNEMDDYEKHMMIDHAKIEHLRCEFCFYRTKLKLDLMQHIREKHMRHNGEKTEVRGGPVNDGVQFWEDMPTNLESNTKTENILVVDEEEIDSKSDISQQDDVITTEVKENLKFSTEENSGPKVKFGNGDKDTEIMVTIKSELDDLFNDTIVENEDTRSYQMNTIISSQESAVSNNVCHNEEVFINDENNCVKIEPEDLEKVEIDISWT